MTSPKDIEISNFVYELPEEQIAKYPLQQRDACRLLCADPEGIRAEATFADLSRFIPSDAMMVCNNTRVINARVRMHKESGAAIEIFCLEPLAPADYESNFSSQEKVEWTCLVGNSKRWKSGSLIKNLDIDGRKVELTASRLPLENGNWAVAFEWNDPSVTFSQVISAAGVIPIPPYLNRNTEDSDSSDYQTIFGHINGSVAAPTAGLHFTSEVIESLKAKGIATREVTLHVGAGTFQPVKSDTIGDHPMHSELIDVSRELIAELATTERPVVAVGTTSVRTLESLYHIGCLIHTGEWNGELPQWYPYSENHPRLSRREALEALETWLDKEGHDRLVASTRIIIAPGYEFKIVEAMVTNFHQPGSTLLLLVSALIGDAWRDIYKHAVETGYRFLSYGDACYFTRSGFLAI